jgi:hypothetical protein
MPGEREDKRTLGVTAEGAAVLESLMATGWFEEEMDAYRLAISVAFAQGLLSEPDEMTGVTTKWNVGTLDPDGKLRSMVLALSDQEVDRPYADAERRAAAGLRYLKGELVDRQAQLAEVLIPPDL